MASLTDAALHKLVPRASTVYSELTGHFATDTTAEQTTLTPRSPKTSLDIYSLPSARTKSLAEEEKELRRQLLTQREDFREETPFLKIIKRCSALQKDVTSQWTDAANTISTRRDEWVQAMQSVSQMKTQGPWKSNTHYMKMRALLESKIVQKTDPAQELDKELVLSLASPVASPTLSAKKRYVSFSDLTPRRLEFLAKARRGFGQHQLSVQELVHTLNAGKDKKEQRKENEDKTHMVSKASGRATAQPHSPRTPKATLINEFILKQRNRYLRNPISRLNIERKQALEAAMHRISASPEILQKAKRLEAREHRRKLTFLQKKAFNVQEKRPDTPIEIRELKAEIVSYRKNAVEEVAMSQRVRKSILLPKE